MEICVKIYGLVQTSPSMKGVRQVDFPPNLPLGLLKIRQYLEQYLGKEGRTTTQLIREIDKYWEVNLTNTFNKKYKSRAWPIDAGNFPVSHFSKPSVRKEVIAIGCAFYVNEVIDSIDEIESLVNLEPFIEMNTNLKPLTSEEREAMNRGIEKWCNDNKSRPDSSIPDLLDSPKTSSFPIQTSFQPKSFDYKHYILFAVFLVMILGVLIAVGREKGLFSSVQLTASTTPQEYTAQTPPISRLLASATPRTPVIKTFDGIDMVLVPDGCFTMGRDTPDALSREKPAHEVCIKNKFWIGRTHITNSQYRSAAPASTNCNINYGNNAPDEPRICVDWFNARDFCESRKERLPSEAEWEWAARGQSGFLYPWGQTYDNDKAWTLSNGTKRIPKVGSYPQGASWVGVLDMSGVLWQWTSSLYWSYPYNADDGREKREDRTTERVLRGGSWDNPAEQATTTYRGRAVPKTEFNSFGFRCVREYVPSSGSP